MNHPAAHGVLQRVVTVVREVCAARLSARVAVTLGSLERLTLPTIVCLGEAGRNPSSDDRLLRTPLEDDFDLDDLTPIIFFICLLKLLNDAMIDVEDAPP